MADNAWTSSKRGRMPWHLWVVAILVLLWNGSGAYTILRAQQGSLPGISAEEAAYYAAQPLWFVILTDIALFAPFVAAVALLLRSRFAAGLFALSLLAILATTLYDFAAETSRALQSNGAMIVTALIVVIAVLQVVYARAMARRGVLR
jgi:hypothetical protein